MTEEEKKDLKKIAERIEHLINDNYCYCTTSLDEWKFVLNLIKKQQKEIERLKNAEEYSKLGKETLLDTIHKQKEEIEELKGKLND